VLWLALTPKQVDSKHQSLHTFYRCTWKITMGSIRIKCVLDGSCRFCLCRLLGTDQVPAPPRSPALSLV
jgi:hypothetical protein